MPVATNLLSAAILAPVVAILSALSLATLQRSLEWVTVIAKTPQKGYLRELRPYFKQADVILERIMGGSKITINTTNILLTAVAVLLLVIILENAEKPKKVTVVEKPKSN